jgi:hypothetical protein
MSAPQEDAITVTIRMDRALHRWLVAQAKRDSRSLNKQIEHLLKQTREREEEAKSRR